MKECEYTRRPLAQRACALVASAALLVACMPVTALAEGVQELAADQGGVEAQAQDQDVYRVHYVFGDTLDGTSDGYVVSDRVLEQPIIDTIKENADLDFAVGEKVAFDSGVVRSFLGWAAYTYGGVNVVPAADLFELAGEETDPETGAVTRYYDITVTATWNPNAQTGAWEPFDENNELLPYTMDDNGTITFDGLEDELGPWYRLDIEFGEGVTGASVIFGGTDRTMTLDASMLPADDPNYDANGYATGPFWVRGTNTGGMSTSLLFDFDDTLALTLELVGNGTMDRSQGVPVVVNLDGPATIKAGTATETVVTNKDGASFSHTVSSAGEDYLWASLTLETTWLGGDEAASAGDAINAAVSDVEAMYVYDIHLLDPIGNVFEIPEGESLSVTLPLPEGIDAAGAHVFHVADNGTVTDMNGVADAEARTITFTTTHFSTFVIAQVGADAPSGGEDGPNEPGKPGEGGSGTTAGATEEKPSGLPATGDAGSAIALVAAASGAVALLGGSVVRRRR